MIRYNFLTERPPDTVMVAGKAYAVNTDFRVGFKLEEIMRSSSMTGEEKILRMLQAYYPTIPTDVKGAVDRALWFYQCGDVKQVQEDKKERYRNRRHRNVAAYSFCQDAPYLYAAFLEQYNIDLCDVEYMHWWKFCAMFESLNDETQMSKIIYYRRGSTTGMPKEKRFFINEMKKKYRLLEEADVNGRITLEQRNMKWREYVKERYKKRM